LERTAKGILTLLIGILLISGCAKKEDPSPPSEVFDPTPYDIAIPTGFPDMQIPEDNPMTVEGISLGRKLFYDPILSADNSQSCASCHNQEFAFTDNGKRYSEGIDGSIGTRNSMNLINAGWIPELFWDGRSANLEEQAFEPVPNPIEMHLQWTEAMNKLNSHPEYPDLFFEAFGTRDIDSTLVVKAIAQFERTLISADTKWDKYLVGEYTLTQAETKGFEIFFTEKGDCFHCHGTILFTDNLFHNNGLDAVITDRGLADVTGNPNDIGKFRSPTLRNIFFTAPYMHDGRFETIEEVIDHYSEGVKWSPTVDPLMKKVNEGGIRLTEEEKLNLIAFLKVLTDSTFVTNPEFANPNNGE
jgi:cytochrome c peroxidase